MKYIFYFLLIFLVVSCNKPVNESDCIKAKIISFQHGVDICDDGATVDKYSFQNDYVYVFNLGDCVADFPFEVINSNCETIGYLGGFAGNDSINGASFSSSAVFVEQVWSN